MKDWRCEGRICIKIALKESESDRRKLRSDLWVSDKNALYEVINSELSLICDVQ